MNRAEHNRRKDEAIALAMAWAAMRGHPNALHLHIGGRGKTPLPRITRLDQTERSYPKLTTRPKLLVEYRPRKCAARRCCTCTTRASSPHSRSRRFADPANRRSPRICILHSAQLRCREIRGVRRSAFYHALLHLIRHWLSQRYRWHWMSDAEAFLLSLEEDDA